MHILDKNNQEVIIMLHNEARKLLIEAWNKTHDAKEIVECFSVNTSNVYRLEKRMRETGPVETRVSQRGRKCSLKQTDIDIPNKDCPNIEDVI